MLSQKQNPNWRAVASRDFSSGLVASSKYPSTLALATHYGALMPAVVDGVASLIAHFWEGVR